MPLLCSHPRPRPTSISQSRLYILSFPFVLFTFISSFYSYSSTLIMSLRIAFSPLRPMASSRQRLAQVSRHFSSTSPAKQEIQDAFILSASRTPTAKVSIFQPHFLSHPLTGCSSMALSSLFQPPNLARSPSSLRLKNRRSPLLKLPMYTWATFYKVELVKLQPGKL